MTLASTTRMTARQYLELGEDPPGCRRELVAGEVIASPRPNFNHARVVSRLGRILGNYIEANSLGEIVSVLDAVLGEFDVRQPDLLFISDARHQSIAGVKAVEGPPDLCVEVVSPSSEKIDRVEKFRLYQSRGVAFYWIIDPRKKTLEAFALKDGVYQPAGSGSGDDRICLPPFDGLELSLGRLWAQPWDEEPAAD